MNLDNINMEDISQILSSLNEDDIDRLKNVAQSFFDGGEESEPQKEKAPPKNDGEQLDFESMKKIMSILKLLKSDVHDPRCDLLYALKPMLKQPRREKVDQAARMLQLLSVLPKLRELELDK